MQLQSIFRGWVIALLVLWTGVVVVMQIFKGGSIRSIQACPDPSGGEQIWVVWAGWLVGCLVIVGLGYLTRRRAP